MFGMINLFFVLIFWGASLFVLYLIIRIAVIHGIDSSDVGQKILRNDFKNNE